MGSEAARSSNLVAFYSLTGHTRALAEEIRAACAGRLEEILETRPRRGLTGETRALFDSMLRRSPAIAAPDADPAQFDMLFLGGPVWAGRIAAPVRSYARLYGRRARRVAFFCTYDSDGASGALQELADLCGHRPESVLAVPAHSLVSGINEGELLRFVEPALVRPPAAAA
jgi:flavodoxin